MPVNRFDRPQGQQYTSTYVPLPLEQIGSLAKQYQDQYQTGKALPQQLDVLGQAIKAAPVDFENKASLIDEYKGKLNDIVSNAKPEDFARPDYQQKVNSIIYQFKNDPRVNAITNNKEVFDKVYTPYLNSKESKEDLVLTNVLDKDDPNKGYKAHPSGYKQMKPGESLAPLDYVKYERAITGAKTIMDGVNIDGTPLSSISQWRRDGNYFIDQDGHKKEITPDKIASIAKANVGNYAENSEGRFRFKTLLNELGGDPHMSYSEFKDSDKISKDAKQYVDEQLANDLYTYGAKQIFKDTDISYNLKTDELKMHAAKKKQDESAGIGLGQTVPSSKIDTYTSVPDKLKGYVREDGTFDWNAMASSDKYQVIGKDNKVLGTYSTSQEAHAAQKKDPYSIIVQSNKGGGSGDEHKVLREYIKESAKLLGKDVNSIKADDYSKIIEERKQYDSILHSEYQFTPAEQKIEKNNILSYRNNYAAFDDSGKSIDNPLLDPAVAKSFQPDRKSYSDNKVQTSGTYIDSNNKLQKVTFRSLSKEKNTFFDPLSQTQNNTASYVRTGNINESVKSQAKDLKKALELPDNIEVVDAQQLGNHNFLTVADKTNRSNTTTYELTKDPNGTIRPYMVGKVSDLHKLAEKYWYLETSEGQAELQSLPSNSTLYKEVSEEEIPK